MTGIVGPNGCGKSNLVEALRWVMGENSAKRMRGGEMDDVIFGGTSDRPARNLAEVVLGIDNTDRKAPAQFNETTELEVSRRIERGEGSAYKVNGRDVRARDVQLLFADAATGAHSPSLVSQGRIGTLINAKPADRRAILEDAAAARLPRLARGRNEAGGGGARLPGQRRVLAERMAQIARDIERERGLAADATAAIERLAEERLELEDGQNGEAETRARLKVALDEAAAAAEAAEAAYSELSQRMAADEARKVGLDRRIAELGDRRARLTRELTASTEQRAKIQSDLAS